MEQATAASGDRNVYVQGRYTAQKAIEEGVLDEIQVHVMPVLLGGGHRRFDTLLADVELEVQRVIDTPHATDIRYRVQR
jgi:dihydrofolate reductase